MNLLMVFYAANRPQWDLNILSGSLQIVCKLGDLITYWMVERSDYLVNCGMSETA